MTHSLMPPGATEGLTNSHHGYKECSIGGKLDLSTTKYFQLWQNNELGVKVTASQCGDTAAEVASSAGDLLGTAGNTIEGPALTVDCRLLSPRFFKGSGVSVKGDRTEAWTRRSLMSGTREA